MEYVIYNAGKFTTDRYKPQCFCVCFKAVPSNSSTGDVVHEVYTNIDRYIEKEISMLRKQQKELQMGYKKWLDENMCGEQ